MPEKTSYQPGEPTWVDLASPDLDASIAFYGGLFGWQAEKSDDPQYGGYTTFTRDGKSVAGLAPLMAEGQPPVWSSYVSVEDADKTAAITGDSGGQVQVPPMTVGDMGRMAFLSDPSGAFIGVWQPMQHIGAQLFGDEGTFCWTELSTRDQAAVHPFYNAVFGWEARVSPGYTEYQLGGESVAGCMDMPEMVPAGVPSYWMPYFAAQDPAAKAQEAAGLGATVLVPLMEMDQVTFSVVQDPHGAPFGLLNVKQ
ncbi:MAG: Glyoxalase/bleomycin resistance protein/dioxygenase [Frankiales bacterium]|nr:Glyoxalase/bleomycin resistance protein/dioxygenase [Frankiales bacterium]